MRLLSVIDTHRWIQWITHDEDQDTCPWCGVTYHPDVHEVPASPEECPCRNPVDETPKPSA